MANTRRGLAAATVGLTLIAGLAGCGKSVDSGDVENELTKALKTKATSAKVDGAECKDDLKAEKDETTECTVKVDGKEQKFTAKVTSVDGDTVRFNFALAK